MLRLRHAIRSLGRSPTFAATAIATLALGIGATTAIFTIINAALFGLLPYPNPEEQMLSGETLSADWLRFTFWCQAPNRERAV